VIWDGLTPPYATIVADPPWDYSSDHPMPVNRGSRAGRRMRFLPYSAMTVWEIAALPVAQLVDKNAHLYLWTTNRYLRDAYMVIEAWGFRPVKLLTWCKTPSGVGLGGAFSTTTEFVIFARRGSLPTLAKVDSTWFQWPRGPHSEKPAAFLDLVEQVSPAPRVELFARAQRLGWDSWGWGYEGATA
jgi:N6-adenosine-specific RNA methylase IME4